MNLGIVVGTVVSTSINDGMQGSKYLLVQRCNQQGEKRDDYLVALDFLGAGNNEWVMMAEGSPARETSSTVSKPVDALIVGIIDQIDENDTVVYRK
jgi:carbon dioxide concentrating mechanism protein CcmL